MPITGIYTFSETKERALVHIPLKGVSPSKVDIFVTTSTLKVNYAPYLVDIVLNAKINPLKHKASVKDGILNITLFKENHKIWNALELPVDDPTHNTVVPYDEIKSKSIAEHYELEKTLDEKRRERRVDDERISTRKQMALDEAERNRLESLKLEEKENAEKEMYAAFSKMNDVKEIDKKMSLTSAQSHQNKQSITTSTVSNEKKIFEDAYLKGSIYSNNANDEDIPEEDDDVQNHKYDATDKVSLPLPLPPPPSQPLTGESKDPLSFLEDEEEVHYVPPPRSVGNTGNGGGGKVEISFTPRVFPTPMRESKAREEADWVAKNRRQLSTHGVLGNRLPKGSGIDISEEDPMWLKAKGDDFYRHGDLLSAVNAYSCAVDTIIESQKKLPTAALSSSPLLLRQNLLSCLSNRSICYLRLKQFLDCEADCVQAINLIDESKNNTESQLSESLIGGSESPSPTVMLIKLLLRVGISYCQSGKFSLALESYQRALQTIKMQETSSSSGENKNDSVPENPLKQFSKATIEKDIENLGNLYNSDKLKKDADVIFGAGNLELALAKYNEALQFLSSHAGCFSNRAACKLALLDHSGCIDDCTRALELLGVTDPNLVFREEANVATNGSTSGNNKNETLFNMLTAVNPSQGTDKYKAWVLKTLVRRGAVYVKMKDYEKAYVDYEAATRIDPNNESLQADKKCIFEVLRDKKQQSE